MTQGKGDRLVHTCGHFAAHEPGLRIVNRQVPLDEPGKKQRVRIVDAVSHRKQNFP